MKTEVTVNTSAVINSHQFVNKPGVGQKPLMTPAVKCNSVDTGSPASGIADLQFDDTFEKSCDSNKSDKAATYTADAETIARLKAEAERHFESFRQIVKQIIEKQGYTFDMAVRGEISIEIDTETQAEAQAQIADNGYWGVAQTSGRILDFAKALSGGDLSKIETLKGAFVEGFKQAKKTFGGELPEISQRTYDAVMKGFEDWASEGTDALPE